MPPKKQNKAPKGGRKTPATAVSQISSLTSLSRSQEADDNATCAFTILNADAAYQRSVFSDAPVGDGSLVHCFGSLIELTVNAVNRTDGQASYISLRQQAAPQQQLVVGSAFDNTGAMTAWNTYNIESYASLPTTYDDMRCVSMMLVCHSAGRNDSQNGQIVHFNLNPVGTAVTEANSTSFNGGELLIGKQAMLRGAWAPGRPEVDYALVGPTATANNQSTGNFLFGAFQPTGVGSVSVRIQAYSIWAARVNPDMEHVVVPRNFMISVPEVERILSICTGVAAVNDPRRFSAKDDGPVGSIIDDGKAAFSAARNLVGPDRTWKERLESIPSFLTGVGKLGARLGTFGSAVMGLFGDEDTVVRRLAGLSDRQLALLQHLLRPRNNPERLDCMTSEVVDRLIERRRARRGRHPRRGRPLVFSVKDEPLGHMTDEAQSIWSTREADNIVIVEEI